MTDDTEAGAGPESARDNAAAAPDRAGVPQGAPDPVSGRGAAPAGDAAAPAGGERIAKVIARVGLASRRVAEKMILDGRVKVNGRTVDSPALDILPGDRVTVDGKPLDAPQETRLWLYYKPAGLVTTESDELGRRTIYDELPEDLPRVVTVGRLDLNSEGLLLLTNDGELKRRLELPATGWLRRYRVRVNGRPTQLTFDPLRRGAVIDGEEFAPMEISLDSQRGDNAWLTIGIREGRNREIRRAMEHVGLVVNRLIRLSYGPFRLSAMKEGEVAEVRRRILRDQLGPLLPGNEEADAKARPARGRPARPARGGAGERPARKPFAGVPRDEGAGDRPGKPFARRPDRDGDAPRRPHARRAEDGAEGARKPFGRRPDGEAPRKFHAARDGERRPHAARDGEGPRKPYAARKDEGPGKPRAPRDGEGPRKPFASRPAAGEAPRKPRHKAGAPRGEGFAPRPPRDDGAPRKPHAPRGEGEGFTPRGSRGGTGGFRREDGEGARPRAAGFKPHGGGGKPRAEGPKPHGGGKPGGFRPRAGGPGKPGGFKPRGDRPAGGRPGPRKGPSRQG